MVGEMVSHFRILKKLGQGGMGEVFKAEDTKLGRTVALKFLSSELNGNSQASLRFQREAQAIAALNHPHICTIFEIGDHEGRPFFAMEYLDGSPLDEVIAADPLPIERLQSLAFQLCDALQEAHSRGILHRDIKPANVFLDIKGTAKLLDFGLAKSTTEPVQATDADTIVAAVSGSESTATVEAKLTQVGSMLGTLLYMSPEQFRGEELDARSDLYSLGRVLYEAATGSVGFEGRSLGEVAEVILNGKTPLASTLRPDVPHSLDVVIQRLLQRNREDRFNSAGEVREAMILAGRDGSTVGSLAPSAEGIRTLGRLRSEIWLIPFMFGAILGGIYIGSLTEPNADRLGASLWLILALGGFALAWSLRRRSSRRANPSVPLKPMKLRRLQEQSLDRSWMWGYLLPGIAAALMTFVTFQSGWKMAHGGDPSVLDLVFHAALTVLFWIPVARARRWRKDAPSRRSREIELEASFPQILSRVSDAIEDLGARVVGLDLDRGWISLTTSSAVWAGMGETVTIRIQETSSGIHAVALESVSIAPWVPFDAGKNNKNLNRIVEILLR